MNPNLYFALYTDDNEAPGLGVHRGHQSWGWSCSSRKRNGGIGAALYLPERFLKVKLWTIWGLIQIACPYRMCDRHMARINSLTSPLPLLPPSSCNEFVHEHASNKMIGLITETNEALSNLVDNNGKDTQCFLVSTFKKLSYHSQHFQKFEALSQVFLLGRSNKNGCERCKFLYVSQLISWNVRFCSTGTVRLMASVARCWHGFFPHSPFGLAWTLHVSALQSGYLLSFKGKVKWLNAAPHGSHLGLAPTGSGNSEEEFWDHKNNSMYSSSSQMLESWQLAKAKCC